MGKEENWLCSLDRQRQEISVVSLFLQAALTLANLGHHHIGRHISEERLFNCVNVILSFQNPSGGFATYENTRSFHFLEVVPPPPLSPSSTEVVIQLSPLARPRSTCTGGCLMSPSLRQHQATQLLPAKVPFAWLIDLTVPISAGAPV